MNFYLHLFWIKFLHISLTEKHFFLMMHYQDQKTFTESGQALTFPHSSQSNAVNVHIDTCIKFTGLTSHLSQTALTCKIWSAVIHHASSQKPLSSLSDTEHTLTLKRTVLICPTAHLYPSHDVVTSQQTTVLTVLKTKRP